MPQSRQPNAVIAIVDDDPSVREGLSSLIRSAGLQVETFASAQEFLARPGAEAPSCLVLDLQLPGLSGLDLQKRMAEVGLEIPIVFLTGHGNIPASVQAMKAGAVEFLTKPFDEQDLLKAIQEAVERDRRTHPSLRVLIVDHSPEDALLVVQELAHSRFRVSWERVENESDYLRQLQTAPDLILADCTLPQFSAVRALQLLQRAGLSIPFIVISGIIGEDTAVAMMKEGATDYVLKDRLSRLGPAVTRVLQGPGKIAYLSMEIVLEASIPTYSGGLGILAGDTIRAAADLRVPMVAVSLLHRTGYFIQRLDASGWQTEEPVRWEVGRTSGRWRPELPSASRDAPCICAPGDIPFAASADISFPCTCSTPIFRKTASGIVASPVLFMGAIRTCAFARKWYSASEAYRCCMPSVKTRSSASI